MRVSNWISAAFIIIGIGIRAMAQDAPAAISGPVLGFIQDRAGTSIQPIVGIAGAAVLGRPLAIDATVRNVVISPKQDYALGLRGENSEAVVIRLSLDSLTVNSLAGARAGADVVAISPAGSAAALYASDSRIFQSIRQFADAPEVVFEFDATDIPGTLGGMAVSDDGKLALLNFVNGRTQSVWVVSSDSSPWLVPVDRPSLQGFLPQRHDAVIADEASRQVFLLLDAGQSAISVPLVGFAPRSGPVSGLAASDDGMRVFVTRKSENITLVDLTTGLSSSISCQCQSTGLHRLTGPALFRLSDPSDGPIAVLDASSSQPRIIIVPASQHEN